MDRISIQSETEITEFKCPKCGNSLTVVKVRGNPPRVKMLEAHCSSCVKDFNIKAIVRA